MSDFAVRHSSFESGAKAYDAGAAEMTSIANGITDPDPMMFGVFLSPLVSFAGSLITNGAKNLLTGVATMETSYAENLRATAQGYEGTEAANERAGSSMVKDA